MNFVSQFNQYGLPKNDTFANNLWYSGINVSIDTLNDILSASSLIPVKPGKNPRASKLKTFRKHGEQRYKYKDLASARTRLRKRLPAEDFEIDPISA